VVLDQRIAVVAPDPVLYEALLREEDAIRLLPGETPLFAPLPRNLLLTPVGRFVLNLYSVGLDGGPDLNMTAQQFRELLASSWLGPRAAANVELFGSVAAQLLDHCRSETDWRDGLDRVARLATGGRPGVLVPPTRRRLPSQFVGPDDAAAWKAALDALLGLRRRLFGSGRGTLGHHVQRLLDELTKLTPTELDAEVVEVMRQIGKALQALSETGTLDVDAREFGAVLSGLSEPRGEEEDDEDDEDERREAPNASFRVRALEAIDGVEAPIVLALGLDDSQMPGGSLDRWPRQQEDAEDWLDRQRYRFLATVRAAESRLILFYPLASEDGACRPSPFLKRVEALVPDASRAKRPTRSNVASGPIQSVPARARVQRSAYSVEELAIAALCPHRWRMEAVEPRLRRFSEPWQLEWLAKADWMAACVERAAAGTVPEAAPALRHRLLQAMDVAESDVRERFAALRGLEWAGVRRTVRQQIDYAVDVELKGNRGRFEEGFATGRNLLVATGRTLRVAARAEATGPREGRRRYVAERDGAWLMHGSNTQEALNPLYKAVNAFQRWSNWVLYGGQGAGSIEDLPDALARLESDQPRRNAGAHCSYCPARPRCLGLDP
jgi:hypothetical protein